MDYLAYAVVFVFIFLWLPYFIGFKLNEWDGSFGENVFTGLMFIIAIPFGFAFTVLIFSPFLLVGWAIFHLIG